MARALIVLTVRFLALSLAATVKVERSAHQIEVTIHGQAFYHLLLRSGSREALPDAPANCLGGGA